MKYSSFLILWFLTGCLVAPEFERSNVYDKNAGEPYIHNFQYSHTANGILFGWIDGSNDNNEYVLTQKMYSHSDVLKRTFVLSGDEVFFLDTSEGFGLPFEVILTSNILNKHQEIQKQLNDTLLVDFGKIEVVRQRYISQNIETTISITGFNPFIKKLTLELKSNGVWSHFAEIRPNEKIFRFPRNLDNVDSLRYGLSIIDFNGNPLRVSSVTIHNSFE